MADEEREDRIVCPRTGSFETIRTKKDVALTEAQIQRLKLELQDIQEVCIFRFGNESCPDKCPVNNLINAAPEEIIAEFRRLTQDPVSSTPGDQIADQTLF